MSSHTPKFQPLVKVQVFLNSKEAQNSNIFATILNTTQQPGSIFVTSFVQVILSK